MAWRIDENLLHGEIDNRIRGRVTGRLWFVGRAKPVELDLEGNAWRDLAGRRLEFVNPEPKPGLVASFATRQQGAAGDITASRKVKVPEIPMDQIGEYYAARKPFPWHWGNSLYLEWFSTANGRVVIESASYQLTISPDSTWDMTPAEEETQRAANGAALGDFMQRLAEAVPWKPDAAEEKVDPADSDDADDADDANRPFTEEQAEKMQADSDKLTDRVMARMEREGETADFEQILEEELERARKARGEPDPTPEQLAERDRRIDEMNAAAEEVLKDEEAEKWKHDADSGSADSFEEKHPLEKRAYELALRVHCEVDARGWVHEDAQSEHPVAELAFSIAKAAAKLAGALDGGDDWPPPLMFCAGTIVRLKRAAGFLEDAKLAAESCREELLVDPDWLAGVLRETDAIAADTAALIAELRARLKNGIE
jgi:hypothetical protein